ncbi:MAG: hypothetical protein U0P30_05300 [Vicinamibacterales bacterium]
MRLGRAGAIRVGLVSGLAISAVDLYAAGGHVPPVMIVVLQIVASGTVGGLWGWAAWPGAIAVAAPLPAVHTIRHALGWPDTISPNTWDSIVMMGLFALAVAGAGFAAGAVLRAAVTDEPR